MFKELKLLKWLILLSLIIGLGYETYQRYQFSFILLDKTSLKNGEPLKFSIASTQKRSFDFLLTDYLSDSVISDTVLKIDKTFELNKMENVLENGYKSKGNDFLFNNLNLSNGFYLVNNEVPLIIKNASLSDITIVYPYVNNSFYTPSNNKFVFDSTFTKVSIKREVPIDEYTKGLKKIFYELNKSYKVNYITDLDLKEKSNFYNTKLLLVYGDLVFWSDDMYTNIKEYVKNGGYVLAISSQLFYSKFYHSSKEPYFSLNIDTNQRYNKSNKRISWYNYDKRENELYSYLHSNYGGGNKNFSGYEINEKYHPVFKGVDSDSLFFYAEFFLGVPYAYGVEGSLNAEKFKNLSPNVKVLASSLFFKNDNLKSSGIFYVKYGKGGVLSLGSSSLALKRNQENNNVKKVIFNSIDYLISK